MSRVVRVQQVHYATGPKGMPPDPRQQRIVEALTVK